MRAKRTLWLLPTVLATTILSFWLVGGTATEAESVLPTFFNAQPQSVDRAAWNAALRAANADASAAPELRKLGAAALPHILPHFDQFAPKERERVAIALLPIAKRMNALPSDFAESPGGATLFWLAYWEEHFVNFREVSVRRAVSRYLTDASPQHEQELFGLDTFALDEVVRQLTAALLWPGNTQLQTRAASLLTDVLSHATELDWRLPPDATLSEAQTLSERWLRWWGYNRYRLTAPRGVERFLAPVLQTRYATWIRGIAQRRFSAASDPLAKAALRAAALLSAGLLLCGWLGTALGAPLAARLGRWLSNTPVALLQLPAFLGVPAAAAVLAYSPFAEHSATFAALVLLGFGATLTSQQRLCANSAPALALRPGLTKLAQFFSSFRRETFFASVNLVPNTAKLLTAVAFVESTLDLDGVCRRTIESVKQRDMSWLMLATISSAVALGLLQLLSDRALRQSSGMLRQARAARTGSNADGRRGTT